MCLYIDKNEHPKLKPLIAKKDIYTLKVANSVSNTKCLSLFREYPQKYNTLLKATIGRLHLPLIWSFGVEKIGEGLHSVISPENELDVPFDRISTPREIILCKIPKGSQYFIGEKGDIVSNQLILLQPIVRNNACKRSLDTKIRGNVRFQYLERKAWDECFNITRALGYSVGL